MTQSSAIKVPLFMAPPLMSNHGCFIGSLGLVTKFLAAKAEALGVEIYPGFAAAELITGENGEVRGIATGDMGIGKEGEPTDAFTRGMELLGKYTLFAEGARGSLSKILIAKHGLAKDCEPPKFGIGLKEIWQVDPSKHKPGLAQHSFGWPLDNATGGGSFLYHYDDNLIAVGFVVHLNYENPLSVAVRGIPALQDASVGARRVRRRQAPRLWLARHHRGRLPVGAEARTSPAAR